MRGSFVSLNTPGAAALVLAADLMNCVTYCLVDRVARSPRRIVRNFSIVKGFIALADALLAKQDRAPGRQLDGRGDEQEATATGPSAARRSR